MVKLNIVTSINQNNIIGINNDLLITSKEDLTNFYKITTRPYPEGSNNLVIMGYNTWISIPETNRPLKKRINIILTQNHKDKIEESENVKVFDSLFNVLDWCNTNETGRVFVIGGESLYRQCYLQHLNKINTIYLTKFMDKYQCDSEEDSKSFPHEMLFETELLQQKITKAECQVYLNKKYIPKVLETHYLIYQRVNKINKGELQYLNSLKDILKEGNVETTRNGKTISQFGGKMVFSMKDGFPLLTSKKMGYKTILRELLWFIKGSTSNQELLDKNVHIWSQNSSREFLDSRGLKYEEGDLGPVYGFQWRHSGAEYKDCRTDYNGKGIDQLQNVIDLIKNDPQSRRIIMNSWNPSDLDKMALPPCHVMCQFNVNTEKQTLDCQLYQRSADMFLGVPFNIASYAFLLHIIANITGYIPGKLIHILGDTHIYEQHYEAVTEQLGRVPVDFPQLIIKDPISNIDSLEESMFEIRNYKSYEKVSAPMIT